MCADEVMARYCVIPSYRVRCCQSCEKHLRAMNASELY